MPRKPDGFKTLARFLSTSLGKKVVLDSARLFVLLRLVSVRPFVAVARWSLVQDSILLAGHRVWLVVYRVIVSAKLMGSCVYITQ